ncbi:MAG: hydrogenase maturation nickel metallochaperone HypA [Coriobacteriales bacterium]|jgi:hydrogenase nickel incorporation protein HypA/HybF
MHEFGLTQAVVETASASAREAGAARVTEIRLTVGELTQVVEEAMDFAFEVLRRGTICEGARLTIDFIAPRSRCLDCGIEFAHDALHRKCPECESPFTQVIAGRELEITSIEVE